MMKNIIAHKIEFMEESRWKAVLAVRTLFLLLWFCSSLTVQAQQARVSGTVLDENASPVPGVTVVEKGTSVGTNTDNDGKYVLNVSSSAATLVFSFIGYKTQELAVNNQT